MLKVLEIRSILKAVPPHKFKPVTNEEAPLHCSVEFFFFFFLERSEAPSSHFALPRAQSKIALTASSPEA
jgi:hypothetical protein